MGNSPRRLESLIAIAASVAGAHRLEDVLDVAASRAREALGAATVSISRWDVQQGHLRTLINDGEEDRWPGDEVYPLDDFPAAVALLRDGLPHIAHADDSDTDAAERRLLNELGWGARPRCRSCTRARPGASSTPPPHTTSRA